jgi:carboxypeptidase family protein/processive rubber oxygenase RoxA-like protein
LQGAGDCDGNEHLPTKCIGALVMRAFTTDPAETNDDLGAPNRAIPGTSGIAGIRLTHMADYVYSESEYVRNPNIGAQGEALSFSAMRGRAIFNDARVGCAQCHNGPSQDNQQFTDKRPLAAGEAGFDPMQPASGTNNPDLRHDVGTANIFDLTDPFTIATNTAPGGVFPNFALPMPAHRGELTAYVTPNLVDAWNTAPYLHDGSAATLMDVIRPCNTLFEDCNAPGSGRNVNDRHGHTSFLSQEQLVDLEAFLKAPHGPVGTAVTQAHLEITSASFSAPEFGYTFAIPYPSGTKVGMTLDGAGHISLNGGDFPQASFDTGLAGIVVVDFEKSVFNGTIDSAGNVSIRGVNVMLTLADTPLQYTFDFTTGTKQLPMDVNKVTGVPFDPEDGSVTLVDLETGPPVPVLGQPTDTVLRIGGYLDTAPLVVSRAGMISGVVRDTMGHPVSGVRIALRHGTTRNAITDANGQFAFRNLRMTGYVLRFSKPKAGRARARVLLDAAHPTAQADVALQ